VLLVEDETWCATWCAKRWCGGYKVMDTSDPLQRAHHPGDYRWTRFHVVSTMRRALPAGPRCPITL